jgi:hypothetical protein
VHLLEKRVINVGGLPKSQQLNLDVRIFLKGHKLRERAPVGMLEHTRWGCSNIHARYPKEADFGHTGHSTRTVLAPSVFNSAWARCSLPISISYLSSMDDGLLLSRFQKRFSVLTRLAELTFGFIFEPWWSPSIQILTFQKKKNKNSSPCHVNYGLVLTLGVILCGLG